MAGWGIGIGSFATNFANGLKFGQQLDDSKSLREYRQNEIEMRKRADARAERQLDQNIRNSDMNYELNSLKLKQSQREDKAQQELMGAGQSIASDIQGKISQGLMTADQAHDAFLARFAPIIGNTYVRYGMPEKAKQWLDDAKSSHIQDVHNKLTNTYLAGQWAQKTNNIAPLKQNFRALWNDTMDPSVTGGAKFIDLIPGEGNNGQKSYTAIFANPDGTRQKLQFSDLETLVKTLGESADTHAYWEQVQRAKADKSYLGILNGGSAPAPNPNANDLVGKTAAQAATSPIPLSAQGGGKVGAVPEPETEVPDSAATNPSQSLAVGQIAPDVTPAAGPIASEAAAMPQAPAPQVPSLPQIKQQAPVIGGAAQVVPAQAAPMPAQNQGASTDGSGMAGAASAAAQAAPSIPVTVAPTPPTAPPASPVVNAEQQRSPNVVTVPVRPADPAQALGQRQSGNADAVIPEPLKPIAQYISELKDSADPKQRQVGDDLGKTLVTTLMTPHTVPLGGTVVAGGKPIYQSKDGIFNQDTLAAMADQYLAGDKSVMQNLGLGNAGTLNRVALRNAITQAAVQRGMSSEQIAVTLAEYSALNASQRTLGNRIANIEMAVTEAQQLAPQVLETSAKVKRTDYPSLNSVLLAGDKQLGDANVVRFGVALNSFINVYSRAINPTGSPTVNDKEHARELLQAAWSHGQIGAAIDQLNKEMNLARKAPEIVQQSIREHRISSTGGRVQGRPAPASQRAFVPPQGWMFSPSRNLYRDPQGTIYDLNGKPVVQ